MGLKLVTEEAPRVGEWVRLPDGTNADVREVEGEIVRGHHHLGGGISLRFWTSTACWTLLRQGVIPERFGAYTSG
jgi:hypothetical protein